MTLSSDYGPLGRRVRRDTADEQLARWLCQTLERETAGGQGAAFARRCGVSQQMVSKAIQEKTLTLARLSCLGPFLPGFNEAVTTWIEGRKHETKELMRLSEDDQRLINSIARAEHLTRRALERFAYRAGTQAARATYQRVQEVRKTRWRGGRVPSVFRPVLGRLLYTYAHIQLNRGMIFDQTEEPGALTLADEAYQTWKDTADPQAPFFRFASREMRVSALRNAYDLTRDERKRRSLADQAERLLEEEVLPLFEQVHWDDDQDTLHQRLLFWIGRARTQLLVGHIQKTEALLAEAAAMDRQLSVSKEAHQWIMANFLRLQAMLALKRGDLQEAQRAAQRACKLISEDHRMAWVSFHGTLLEVLVSLQDTRRASELARRLRTVSRAGGFDHQLALIDQRLEKLRRHGR